MDKKKLQALDQAAGRAYEHCRPNKQLLDEFYAYVLPERAPEGSAAAKDGSRNDRIFDGTATRAAYRFAGRMQQEVTPAFQSFFELKAGPYLPIGGDQKKELDEQLADISKKIMGVIEGAEFATAAGEMYLDLFAGTAAFLMLEDEHDICRFVDVPVGEIALREDGFGRVVGVYWKKIFKAGAIATLWPEDRTTISAELAKIIEEDPDADITICQACEFNSKTRQWDFTAYRPDKLDEGTLYETQERTNPWLTPRFYKVPGKAMGTGPGLTGLPTAKTLNKVTELSIKAAAFAILGLWIYKNDRVFNPKTARMKPGAMWAVGATSGQMGASVQRLEVPGRFDISNLILQDLRESLKQIMLDDTLPPDSGAVRSATEIVGRMKRLSQDLSGAYSRLILEIIKPLIQRIIDLLDRRKLIQGYMAVDQLLLKLEITSPIAKMQQAQDVSNLVEGMQIMLSLGGQEIAMLTAKVEEVFGEILRKLGWPEKLIRSQIDKQMIQQMIAKIIVQSQQGSQQAQPQGQPPTAAARGAAQQAA